jgi:hypothetical protein
MITEIMKILDSNLTIISIFVTVVGIIVGFIPFIGVLRSKFNSQSNKRIQWEHLYDELIRLGFTEIKVPQSSINDSNVYIYFSFPPTWQFFNIITIYYISLIKYLVMKFNIVPVFVLAESFMECKLDGISEETSKKWASNYECFLRKYFNKIYIFTDRKLSVDYNKFIDVLRHIDKATVNSYFIVNELLSYLKILKMRKTTGHYVVIGGEDQKNIWDKTTEYIYRSINSDCIYAYHPLTKSRGLKISIFDRGLPSLQDTKEIIENKMDVWALDLNDNTNFWTYLCKIILFHNGKIQIQNMLVEKPEDIKSLEKVDLSILKNEIISQIYSIFNDMKRLA